MLRTSTVIGLIAVIVSVFLTTYLQLHRKVEYNDDDCVLLPDIGPCSEDIAVVNNQLALVSAGDLDRIFFKNTNKPVKEGSIYAVRFRDGTTSPRSEKIPLENFPNKDTFHPHGISYSNRTGRLYAVSHECGKRTFEGIEIFQLVMGETDDSIKLVHEATLESPSFPLGSLNSVVEGAYLGEFYVTQWISVPISEKCAGEGSVLKELKLMFTMMFLRASKIHRCLWNPQNLEQGFACSVAAKGFKSVNGITSDPEKKHIYAVDPVENVLHVFDRKDDGTLNRTVTVSLPHTGDNIDFDVGSQKLTLSGSPLFHQIIRRTMGDRSVQVSGGMLTIDPYDEANYKLEEVLMHDGSQLSMISSAVFTNGKVLLGSPASDGVLVCPIPAKN